MMNSLIGFMKTAVIWDGSMAKATQAQWDKAKALFEAGKSLREIEGDTKIPLVTLHRVSKKEGWEKSKTERLIQDVVRVSKEMEQLNETARSVVSQEIKKAVDVDAISDAWDMIMGHAANASKRLLAKPDVTSVDILNIAKAGETSKVTLKKLPRFAPQQTAVKVDVNTEKNEISPQLKSAADIIES